MRYFNERFEQENKMSNPENENYKERLLIEIDIAQCKGNLKLDSQSNFKWEYNGRYFCSTSQEVDSFLKLLVSYNYNDEIRNEDDIKEDFEEIKECFFNDIVIDVLTESVEELTKHLKNKVKYKDLVGELFYTVWELESWVKKVPNERLKKNIEMKDIINKLYTLKNINSFLKILTPWIIFVLLLTSNKREVNFESLYKYFKLINPKYSVSDIKVYNNIQENLDLFMYLLNEYKFANKSLCLNILNKYTDYFDIDNLVKNYSKLAAGNDNKKEIIDRFKFITKIDSFSVKDMMITSSYSFYLLNYQGIWEIYSVLFNKCKEALKDSIEILKERIEFEIELPKPKQIRNNYLIYKLFLNEDPYDYIIEDYEEQFAEGNQSIDEEYTWVDDKKKLDIEYISLLEKYKNSQVEEFKSKEDSSLPEEFDLFEKKYLKVVKGMNEMRQTLEEEKKEIKKLPKQINGYNLPYIKIEKNHSLEEYGYVYQMIYNEKYKK